MPNLTSRAALVSLAEQELDELERLVLWELPAHHKGFPCQWSHNNVRRAFQRAREMMSSGEAHNKRCRCRDCVANTGRAKANSGEAE